MIFIADRCATQGRAERFVGKRQRLIGRKSPPFWPNITASKLPTKRRPDSAERGWRTKPTGPMNHIAQMCANLIRSFEAMSCAAAYGKLKFGPFELSSRERVLRRDGVVLPLGDRALDILIYLAERACQELARRDLMGHVWRS